MIFLKRSSGTSISPRSWLTSSSLYSWLRGLSILGILHFAASAQAQEVDLERTTHQARTEFLAPTQLGADSFWSNSDSLHLSHVFTETSGSYSLAPSPRSPFRTAQSSSSTFDSSPAAQKLLVPVASSQSEGSSSAGDRSWFTAVETTAVETTAVETTEFNSAESPASEASPQAAPLPELPDRPSLPPLLANSVADPELGDIKVKPLCKDELCLKIRPIPRPAPKQPKPKSVFLLGRVDYFRNSNVLASDEKVADGLVRSGFTLFYAPALGRDTFVITSFDASLVRYFNVSRLNYDELRFRVGLYQRLSPRMGGEVGWTNQQLFSTDRGVQSLFNGDRFFNDNALRLELNRQDPLGKNLNLSTYYQFRWSTTTELEKYDRLVHSLISSLSYSFSKDFQMAVDYQFIWSHFTQQPRDDFYHQVGGRLTYTINPRTQLNVVGGITLGSSTNDRLDFNGWLVGVGLVFNLPLF
ncbi:MAG: hypothetical protein VKJ24_17125 [Synechococcales bacterium]|nr:hypothetical protein [Synechococcales bacterium]